LQPSGFDDLIFARHGLTMVNTLEVKIFAVVLKSGEMQSESLPSLYAAMMADAIEDMPAVRPHQRQPLHCFLAQVGALALLRANATRPPEDGTAWRALLRGLTPDHLDDAPWTLVVADVTKPALLQPPIADGRIEALKEVEHTPDALDMLVTSKNHDVKRAAMAEVTAEHWLLSLLTLQTLEGFLGAGNYGISRMNGGFASRPMVGLAPDGGWGARLRRDIEALVERRREILSSDDDAEAAGFKLEGGLGLLWLPPWDGFAQLRLTDLDPYYVEICRRVRLVKSGGRMLARRGGSKAARIAMAKELKGRTGDAWAPIDRAEEKVLTLDGEGFHYRRVCRLLDPAAYAPAPLQRWRREDGTQGLAIVFAATVRGQGGTDGFHERRIPVPDGIAARMGDTSSLASLAKLRVDDAGAMRLKVLKPALLALLQNAPEAVNYKHQPSETKAEVFLAAFDRVVDRGFFPALFLEYEAADMAAKERARIAWLVELQGLAEGVLRRAERATPRSAVRHASAVAAARDTLANRFRHVFPQAAEAAA
jgi:CRISPR system Cascade subunit CasA